MLYIYTTNCCLPGPYDAELQTLAKKGFLMGSSQLGHACLTRHSSLQVMFSFADYDDICRRLQSRQLQPSLLGSSALIPYATLGSLR